MQLMQVGFNNGAFVGAAQPRQLALAGSNPIGFSGRVKGTALKVGLDDAALQAFFDRLESSSPMRVRPGDRFLSPLLSRDEGGLFYETMSSRAFRAGAVSRVVTF